jgi:hypothetical protein
MLAAFGVGLANFSTGRQVGPRELAACARKALPLIAWYGATGNFALADCSVDEAGAILSGLSGTDWAVLPFDEVDAALEVLSTLTEPACAIGERATPGLAFAVTAADSGPVASTQRAALRRVSDRIVAVHKLDQLQDGKLDRQHRRGGWGAVSADIGRQVGGRWTARSRRTLEGLRRRASDGISQDPLSLSVESLANGRMTRTQPL